MRPWLLRLAAIALLVGIPSAVRPEPAMACICGDLPSLREELEVADAVFVGTLVEIIQESLGDGVVLLDVDVVFEVNRVWKGDIGSTIVLGHQGGSTCSAYLELGEDHIVYAYAFNEEDDFNVGGVCGNTGPLAGELQDVLEVLGPGQVPEPGTEGIGGRQPAVPTEAPRSASEVETTRGEGATKTPPQFSAADSGSSGNSPPPWATGLLASLLAALTGTLVTLGVVALRRRARQT